MLEIGHPTVPSFEEVKMRPRNRNRAHRSNRPSSLLLIAVAFGVVLAPPLAGANPLPLASVFTHVQAHDPDFCSTTTITTCAEIVQVSGASGTVDFGLFYEPVSPMPETIEALALEVFWPEYWDWIEADICCGAAEVIPIANGAQILITLDPGYTMEDFFTVGRVTLGVSGAGRLAISDASVTPAGQDPFWVDGIPGRAANPCATCVQPCDYADYCFARADTDLLELTTEVGATTEGMFHGWASGLNPLCGIYFSTEADWLELEVVEAQSGYDIIVTADATGLAPGYHSGWVIGSTPSCYGCVEVRLTVTDGSPAERHSWGSLKAIYR